MDTRDGMESDESVEAHTLSAETARDYQVLRSFLESGRDNEPEIADADDARLIREWRHSVFQEIPLPKSSSALEDDGLDVEPNVEYFRYAPAWRSTWRTFHAQLEISQTFGRPIADRIAAIVAEVVLHGMVWNRTPQFIARAPRTGLTWRRPRLRPFRPPLPYRNPDPTRASEQIVQEAGLIDAALTFALLARDGQPSRRFVINASKIPRNGNKWTLGSATRNFYPDKGYLRIKLNALAFEGAGLSNKRWGGIIAHEMLHNMGWGHPKGVYRMSMPIEIYEACIEERAQSVIEEIDEH